MRSDGQAAGCVIRLMPDFPTRQWRVVGIESAQPPTACERMRPATPFLCVGHHGSERTAMVTIGRLLSERPSHYSRLAEPGLEPLKRHRCRLHCPASCVAEAIEGS